MACVAGDPVLSIGPETEHAWLLVGGICGSVENKACMTKLLVRLLTLTKLRACGLSAIYEAHAMRLGSGLPSCLQAAKQRRASRATHTTLSRMQGMDPPKRFLSRGGVQKGHCNVNNTLARARKTKSFSGRFMCCP